MFRLMSKLIICTLALVVLGLFVSDNKASAAVCSGTPYDEWGVRNGQHSNLLAGLRVHAQNGITNEQINVGYKLNSDLPGSNNDAKIFKYPVGEEGRDSQHWFRTGEQIHDGSGSGGYQCDGWSILGPGLPANPPTPAQHGNGWVLDCGDGSVLTDFWISDINKPAGQGNGRWRVEVRVPDENGNFSLKGEKFLDEGVIKFNAKNGDNIRLDLIWVPDPPQPPQPEYAAECTHLYAENVGRYFQQNKRTHVEVTGVVVGRTSFWGQLSDPVADPANGKNKYNNINEYIPDLNGEGTANKKTSKEWWYQPVANKVHIKITVESWDGNSWAVRSTIKDEVRDCFTANCNQQDLRVTGRGPNNVVIAGDWANISGTYTNTSPPPDRMTLWNPALIGGPGGGNTYGVGVQEARSGATYGFSFWIPAPSGITEENWSFTPKYFGPDAIGDICWANIKTFKYFELNANPEVKLEPTLEDPTAATFIGHASTSFYDSYYPNGFEVDYAADSKRKRYSSPSEEHFNNINGYGPIQTPYTYGPINPQPNNAGDKYCLYFDVVQDKGWVGPRGAFGRPIFVNTANSPGKEHCLTVHDEPYLHAYGADVTSGSDFAAGEVCNFSGNTPGIKTYRSTVAGKSGSGAQFAAMALGAIEGFRSASVRSDNAKELSFANTTPGDGGLLDGANAICAQDFYGEKQNSANVISSPFLNINSLADGKQSFRDGNLVIFGGNNVQKKTALFVNGDVVIGGNITFPVGKYFALIVRGNIYINKNVSTLDGLYIAQPRDANNGGNIYTCTNGFTAYTEGALYANCRPPQAQQLKVNGAFIAKSVKFLRTYKSLRDSCNREFVTALGGCGPSNAAEIFNFSPEVYLYMDIIFGDSTTGQPYDAITTLPPVL